MHARVFISYRTADGMDKATALARDLGARFGDDQVFLDKDDLRGGSSWREEVGQALGARPVLLLLLTPQFFAAADASGRPRLEDPADPVRREFETALEAGARIIPVCCDGVESPPAGLAPPFDRIGDYTWRRLRAYDWRHDIERLAGDLLAMGIEPLRSRAASPGGHERAGLEGSSARGDDVARGPHGRSAAADAQALAALPEQHAPTGAAPLTGVGGHESRASTTGGVPRRLALAALGVTSLGAVAVAVWTWRSPSAPTEAADPPRTGLVRPGLPGTWIATVAAEPPFALTLRQQDDRVALTSEPMPVAGRAGWDGYREFWLRLTGTELRDVAYRGQGTVVTDPLSPLAIDIAWTLFNGAGDTKIDTGNLHAVAAPDGSGLVGTLWSNGDQASKPIVLKRPR